MGLGHHPWVAGSSMGWGEGGFGSELGLGEMKGWILDNRSLVF